MSILGTVGRKRFRARIAMSAIYILLVLGAITTLYPFLIMITTGFKDTTDQNDFSLIPIFWTNENALYNKYIQDKYAGNLSLIESSRLGAQASPKVIHEYNNFLRNLPIDYWVAAHRTAPTQVTSKLARKYQEWLRHRYKNIDELNKAYVEENLAFEAVMPPNEMLERKRWQPRPGLKSREWEIFKKQLPSEYRIPILERRMFQEFLRSKYENQINSVPITVRLNSTKFEQILLAKENELYKEFRAKALPSRYAKDTVESLWAKKHSEALPIEAAEKTYVKEHATELRKEFSSRNYSYVMSYLFLHGRSFWNTLIFCGLAITLQLILNTLAAYALSRYPIKASGKILIFLLATMAFPAEVTLIPSFLLLRDLGLLNTFAALVLPTAVSGYMIFLLKSFFDSLPQELFESGQIDGAKESTMLSKIALPLSRPVLGYMALLAFMGAYSAFMYAFLVAQDQRMWTLMVWIYQLQISAPKATIMAALALSAIPTLIVFLLAQRTIARGIVLPGER